MGKAKGMALAAVGVMLGACSSQEPAKPNEAVAQSLAAGLYEASIEVTRLTSTDNTTPATKLKEGDRLTAQVCVGSDGKPEPAMLAEEGDSCQIKNSYIRNGRMNAEGSCTREGRPGQVMPAMNGSFTADGFSGEITTLTYFAADGDYRMSRKVTGRRVGDCPAEGAAEPAAAS